MGAGERKIAFRLPMVTCSDAFFDIEILLSRIRNPQSKVYFLDAATAYKARVLGGRPHLRLGRDHAQIVQHSRCQVLILPSFRSTRTRNAALVRKSETRIPPKAQAQLSAKE